MHLMKDKNGVLIGAVLNPDAISIELQSPHDQPPDGEPNRKKRKVGDLKYQSINEWKRAVQERLSPVLSVFNAWRLARQASASLPSSLMPLVHCVNTDWCVLFQRRFELWPKFTLQGKAAEALFGRMHFNPSSAPMTAHISFDSSASTPNEIKVELPPNSRFLMSHGIQSLTPLLQEIEGREERFTILVVDPPWENASVKRGGGGYESLPAGDLCKLPLGRLIDQNDGCCFLWVTNRPRIHNFINEVLLGRWGLKLIRTWYWIKTDLGGRPVIPLDCLHRHCYEPLMILVPADQDPARLAGLPRDGFAFFSVAREHSRKPFLCSLISQLFPTECRKARDANHQCELFARELHEGWTSWGDEVLKFQEIQPLASKFNIEHDANDALAFRALR